MIPERGFDAADVMFAIWTMPPDDSWIDAQSSRGEELEALEQVISEQTERISRLR